MKLLPLPTGLYSVRVMRSNDRFVSLSVPIENCLFLYGFYFSSLDCPGVSLRIFVFKNFWTFSSINKVVVCKLTIDMSSSSMPNCFALSERSTLTRWLTNSRWVIISWASNWAWKKCLLIMFWLPAFRTNNFKSSIYQVISWLFICI